MQTVITYAFAYTPGQIQLCARHAKRPPSPLGPVQHGAHEGDCEQCILEREIVTDAREVIARTERT